MKKITTFLLISMAICVTYALTVLGASFSDDLSNLEAVRPDMTASYFTQDKVRLKEAWGKLNNDPPIQLQEVKIGIVDNRIDASHSEFIGKNAGGNIIGKVNFGNTPQWVLSPLPALFAKENRNHGMGVAGIIGANNISVSSSGGYDFPHMNGVLSGVGRIPYVLEIRSPLTPITTFYQDLGRIDKLAQENVSVVNLSRGTGHLFGALIMVKKKLQSHSDILFIVSAGNGGKNASLVSPANLGNELPNVITVGAVNNNDERAFFSNFGDAVNISAPGINLYTPAVRGLGNLPQESGDYQFFNGTSASAPLVTGVAGLLKSIKPNLSPFEMKSILTLTADPITATSTEEIEKTLGMACNDGRANFRGCRLNALRAVCHPSVLNCAAASLGIIEGFTKIVDCSGTITSIVPDIPVSVLKEESDGSFTIVAETISDSSGFYRITVPIGIYTIGETGNPVTVQAGETANHDAVYFEACPN